MRSDAASAVPLVRDLPTLLAPGSLDKLLAMARQADESLRAEFGLPLGLVVIDTVAASAGYAQMGAESDNAIGQQIMKLLKLAAGELDCFVLGVDHFGKNINSGTRGAGSKEDFADLVLACLGERGLSGRVTNLRLAVRKCRGGRAGREFPFTVREVQDPNSADESTLVIQWEAAALKPAVQSQKDLWEESRRTDTRQGMLLLKRVLMAKLAAAGVELLGEPTVWAIDREIVREEFFLQTPADGTERQKQNFRHRRFIRALDRAIEKQLVGCREFGSVTYLWLLPQQPEQPDPGDEF